MLRPSLLSLLLIATGVYAQGTPALQLPMPANAQSAHLRIVGPHGELRDVDFAQGSTIALSSAPGGVALADGSYQWELRFAPVLSAPQQAQFLTARDPGGNPATVELIPAQSGSFQVLNGQLVPPTLEEATASSTQTGTVSALGTPVKALDVVTPDDHIVQGNQCVGLDCVNNEVFGTDNIRMKENNTRLTFIDTSTGGAFADGDWRLRANEITNGGANLFAIDWLGNNYDPAVNDNLVTSPFQVMGGAPDHALHIGATGSIGINTNTPTLQLHLNRSDTPAIRLEQNNSGGYTAQTWDVAGNETNFFVRDLTSGSRLPFRIRPGAPTSSIDIAASGRVGMGIAAPEAALHLRHDPQGQPLLLIDVPDDSNPATDERRLRLDDKGNLYVAGAITQLSSRTAKDNFLAVMGPDLLERLRGLPIWTWSYLSNREAGRHIGPVAEDFHRQFGFGTDARSLSPSDVAGVALAAAQALQQQVADRDRAIETLEARLARLEAALSRLTNGQR